MRHSGARRLINSAIIKFSVDWWNTLHQGESIFRLGGPTMAAVYLLPLFLMGVGYSAAFAALWIARTSEVWRRRPLSWRVADGRSMTALAEFGGRHGVFVS